MLETLISSKTRIKLLLKFFLNSKATSYLRGLETEFGDSTNSIRIELNRFEKAGMLKTYIKGNKKYFQANTDHPLYKDTHNILLKYIGFDKIIDTIIENIGDLKKVYVTGALAQGIDAQNIDLVFFGDVNTLYLSQLVEKIERHISRKIRYSVFSENELQSGHWEDDNGLALLLWENA